MDFKVSFESQIAKSRADLAIDCVAFANTDGGFILVGVQDQTWRQVGIGKNGGNTRRAKIWFSRALRRGRASSAIELAKLHLTSRRKADSEKAIQYLRSAIKSRHVSQVDLKEAKRLLGKAR